MSVPVASATATFSADELIVESSDGKQYRLRNFSKTVNLGVVGAGGMDTGSVPVAGFVALYAIYNPTTNTSALLSVNATSAVAPEIYGGTNMPTGYTASALVSVWRTESSKFAIGYQTGRKILTATTQLATTTSFITTPTALNISSAIPKNAKFVDGILYLTSTNSQRTKIAVQPTSNDIGVKQFVTATTSLTANGQSPFSDLSVASPQTIYWSVDGLSGDVLNSAFVYSTAYSI
ncbi:hypothetical protein ACUOIW_18260 [Escherichia coli]